ncbi:MAG: alpha-glucosidase/alpha-galactosidase [Thermomicrobiales bacterium]|nr:alpha-glucosidase/alpha-galactosidase [Thermomicrobiales bacterium]
MPGPVVAFIGAGSAVFARNLLGDILSLPALREADIRLFDINPERLRTSEIMAGKVATATQSSPSITATTDPARALAGADYVICMIQVGGYEPATVIDFEIPKKYGLRQTIGDTLGIGGIMRGLRTIPVLLDYCRLMEEHCPDAIFLQYVNPMAMNCWAIGRASSIRTIGLCHSVQGTAEQLVKVIGVPIDEITYKCAGINHVAFYLSFKRGDEDLYPAIRKVIADGRVPDDNRVRFEMLKRLGYFVTESSEHFAEYNPWFIKEGRDDLIERFNIPLDEYPRRCENQIAKWEAMRMSFENDEPLTVKPTHEYAASIINAMETGVPAVVYGNVPNNGLISNLPADCCVEVPVLVDRAGLQPTQIGELPPQLAAYMQTNINVQRLTVEAALTGKREHIYHAAMLDPHTAAELDLDQIWSLVDDLIAAHGAWLPEYV